MSNLHYNGPVVLVVMDGVGLSDKIEGNAVKQAHLETLNRVMRDYPMAKLGAAGRYVGVPVDDMGNSEVGHNAMGTGEVVLQRSAAVENAFKTGDVFKTDTWQGIINQVKNNNSTLHFMGIFSDGNVHSDIMHVEKMSEQALKDGVKRIRVHTLLDGRDVPPTSEPKYIQRYESFVDDLAMLNGGIRPDFKIASGGGRMVITADRYESNWDMVRLGWETSVLGRGRQFKSATEAVETYRAEAKAKGEELQDQYVPPFVIAENGLPIGTINNGDAVVYIDFRADRALEMTQAFTYNDFPHFDRIRRPEVYFAGMNEYNEDLHVPEHTLVATPSFKHPLAYHLSEHGIKQYAISEAVKFGHITYYFNGCRHDVPAGEVEEQIASYVEPFNTRPWMKTAEITDWLINAIESQNYQFLRINYPGGDMVGHFGQLEPTIVAMESIDLSLKRIINAVNQLGGVTVITADHGNAEELIDENGAPKTSHTTNKVPCVFVDNTENAQKYQLAEGDFGLGNIASTISTLLGVAPDPEWLPSIIEEK